MKKYWMVDVVGSGSWSTNTTYIDIEAETEEEASKIARRRFNQDLEDAELETDIDFDSIDLSTYCNEQ